MWAVMMTIYDMTIFFLIQMGKIGFVNSHRIRFFCHQKQRLWSECRSWNEFKIIHHVLDDELILDKNCANVFIVFFYNILSSVFLLLSCEPFELRAHHLHTSHTEFPSGKTFFFFFSRIYFPFSCNWEIKGLSHKDNDVFTRNWLKMCMFFDVK